MSEIQLDGIDIQLLNRAAEMPGKSVTRIVKTLDCRTAKTLRDRIDRLAGKGYIRLDRASYCGKVLVYLTEAGKAAITGWEDAAPGREVTSL